MANRQYCRIFNTWAFPLTLLGSGASGGGYYDGALLSPLFEQPEAGGRSMGLARGETKVETAGVDTLYEAIRKEQHPVIEDMNDVSGSYTLQRIESVGLADA